MSERRSRVIGAEHVVDASRRGRKLIEVLSGDIVTPSALESANRLQINLHEGPVERPSYPQMDGGAALRRGLYRRSPKWISSSPATSGNARKIKRLALVGGGGVGANVAHLAANAELAEHISITDITPGVAEAVALDLNHASGVSRSQTRFEGGTGLELVEGAEVVVVTAGRPRTPGMSRSDLITINRRVMLQVSEAIKTHAPDSIVIVVTNPLDEMTTEVLHATGFDRSKVLGMAGTLDSSRFRYALAKAADVPIADVEAFTLGSHGDEMVPIVSQAKIRNRRIGDLLSEDAIQTCVQETVHGGASVVALKKTGSATLAPAHAIVEMLHAIRGYRTGPLPVSVMLNGEYGISDVVVGVPCHLGASGLLNVVEIDLSETEQQQLNAAAQSVAERSSTTH